MNETEFFYKLKPQTIIDAVESVGYETTGLCWKLNSLENRVYDLELDDKSHIVVKFYRPGRWSEAQILEEHDFLFDLKSHEIPVCTPLRFKDGASLKKTENIYYAVWQRTGGRCIDEFSDEHLGNLGRLLGRIHIVGKMKEAPNRLKLTAENLGEKPLEFLKENEILPAGIEKRYTNAVNNICSIFNEMIIDVPYHRIHGDCHIGNLLFGDTGFYFLDFDDFYTGPAVQDFWMLFGIYGQESLLKLNILLDAYRTFADFDEKWLNLIEPLRALRFIHYAGWVAKRWADASFKDAFPHFGTAEYWEQETNDIEEQIKIIGKTNYVINESKLENKTEETEPEISNKDIFWDWEE